MDYIYGKWPCKYLSCQLSCAVLVWENWSPSACQDTGLCFSTQADDSVAEAVRAMKMRSCLLAEPQAD